MRVLPKWEVRPGRLGPFGVRARHLGTTTGMGMSICTWLAMPSLNLGKFRGWAANGKGWRCSSGPLGLAPEGDSFYRNDGGSFVEVTEETGLAHPEPGYGFGVLFVDVDGRWGCRSVRGQ